MANQKGKNEIRTALNAVSVLVKVKVRVGMKKPKKNLKMASGTMRYIVSRTEKARASTIRHY